ncbi:MAG: type II toxin-antitoxin system VapB family antitoxin [Xanthobacteraceae bacterium]
MMKSSATTGRGFSTNGDAVALNIKNAEAERLARELARRRGQTITEALTDVLRKEVERERAKPRHQSEDDLVHRVRKISERVSRLPVLDDRSPDEIIGYNEQGHFD